MTQKWDTISFVRPTQNFTPIELQGEAVLITEDISVIEAIKILTIAIKLSGELAVEENVKNIIIFSNFKNNVIRREQVEDFFVKNDEWNSSPTLDCENKEEQIIDLDSFKKLDIKKESYFGEILEVIKKLESNKKYYGKTTIKGRSSKLLTILIVYFMHGRTKELFFEDANQKQIKIF